MVWADDSPGTTARTAVEQPRGTMPAHVEEGFDVAVLAAHRHQGLAEKIQGVVVAGIRYIVEVAHDLPRSGKHALLLGFEEIRIPVDPSGQAESFQVGGNLRR